MPAFELVFISPWVLANMLCWLIELVLIWDTLELFSTAIMRNVVLFKLLISKLG